MDNNANKSFRLGILGGCFDPVHWGHMHAVQTCIMELSLDLVLLVPSAAPHYKACRTPFHHRHEMCLRATEEMFKVAVSSLEGEKTGEPYTYRTLQAIRQSHPDAELFFIMGSDVFRNVPGWQGIAAIARLATLAVIARPGALDHDVERTRVVLAAEGVRSVVLSESGLQLSSTGVREKVGLGYPVDGLIPQGVAEYIREKGLYAEPVISSDHDHAALDAAAPWGRIGGVGSNTGALVLNTSRR